MKKYLLFILTALLLQACPNNNSTTATSAAPTQETQAAVKPQPSGITWNGSTLSETTIKQVQEDKYHYKQCVYKEAQKQGYQTFDSRVATDAVIRQCESTLAKIRTTFVNDGVPEVITDRFLKKTRIDMTRKILQSLMFAEASRKAGAIQ